MCYGTHRYRSMDRQFQRLLLQPPREKRCCSFSTLYLASQVRSNARRFFSVRLQRFHLAARHRTPVAAPGKRWFSRTQLPVLHMGSDSGHTNRLKLSASFRASTRSRVCARNRTSLSWASRSMLSIRRRRCSISRSFSSNSADVDEESVRSCCTARIYEVNSRLGCTPLPQHSAPHAAPAAREADPTATQSGAMQQQTLPASALGAAPSAPRCARATSVQHLMTTAPPARTNLATSSLQFLLQSSNKRAVLIALSGNESHR